MVIIKFIEQSLLESAFTRHSSGFNVEFPRPRQIELICASKTYVSDRLNNGSAIYIYTEQLHLPEISVASTPVLYEQELETGSLKRTKCTFGPAFNQHPTTKGIAVSMNTNCYRPPHIQSFHLKGIIVLNRNRFIKNIPEFKSAHSSTRK